MSHFISNTKNLENMPIFSLPSKEIIMPKIKKYIKTKGEDSKATYRKESKLLNTICQRLQKEEFEQIHNQNAMQMERKFQKLKKKMHKNMEKQSVQNIFNSEVDTQKLNIRQIVKMRPQRIQLQKKYGNQILLKMQNFREAEQINVMKQKYRNWYDNEKNDRCNSPIFKKMAFLLQKASKQDILDQLPLFKPRQKIRHTTKQGKQNSFHNFEDKLSKNNSPYKKRQLDWSTKKQKFSIFNHNYQS